MKNLTHAAVVTLFAASAAQAQQAVQWRVQDGGNGHWYQRISTPMSFNDAQGAAILRGAHLATCADAGEWGRVVGVAAAAPQQELYFWVGLYQNQVVTDFAEPAGGWRWVDGTQVGFSAWLPGEPNNTHGVEDFGHGFVSSSGASGWNDTFGRASFVSVIEWSADCNGDGVVDYGQCLDGTLPDYNGNNIPDCCERGDACVVGRYPVQWRVEAGGNGHWYQVRPKVGDWLACRAAAQGLMGDLASPSTASENSFVERLVPPKQFPIWNRVFLGGRQSNASAPNEGWYWVDGSAWSYEDWFENQPDGGEGFLVIMPDESGCTWGDYPANSSDIYYFMVEWSADCNQDGFVDYGQILTGQLADLNSNGFPDVCEQPTCHDVDLYTNGRIDGADLAALLSEWGPSTPTTQSDFNHDGVVDGSDLSKILGFWGPCPN